ncbi:MAG: Endonuclease/Exonuclease/phosphatase family protein [Lacunisphaera sp.]|nr:Endonuclease/Exonuclease/phosphatase family protein [Lacunisphaera sp.]
MTGFLRPFALFVAISFWLVSTASAALTIAAYNVENYTIADRLVDGVYRPAYPKPEKEKAALRQVIAGIAPDILAVEEMGTQAFLDDFQRELKQVGQNYPYTALLQAADTDRHVAVLSKIPFKEVRRHAAVAITYFKEKDVVKRGVLEVIFATNEGDFSLFIIHLKSRRTERKDDPESNLQRGLEAEAVRDLALSRYPDPTKGKFIICGDWNDTRDTRPIRALQKRGDTELGEILRASDSRGETWTHYYRREDSYSRIDYFLASPAMKPFVTGARATIWDGPGVAEGSDHRPVFVQLKLDAVK